MVEMLSHGFMLRALAAGVLVGSLCALVSVFVNMNRLSFIGAGLSHSAFGGMALGALAGMDVTFSALVYCVAVSFLISWLSRKGGVSEDVGIGVVFSASMAIGVVALGFSEGYTVDLFSYLFGSILAVSWADVAAAGATLLLVAGVIWFMFKELLAYSFDEEWARVCGVDTAMVQNLLLACLAFTIVVSIKLMGVILVSALIVIPGAIGRIMAANWRGQLMVSQAAGILPVLAGLYISYRLDIASGAAIALAASGLFLAAAAHARTSR